MIKGKHIILGSVEIRNENKAKYNHLLISGQYEITIKKPQIMVYCDRLQRGLILTDDNHKEYMRLNGSNVANVIVPISEVRIESK